MSDSAPTAQLVRVFNRGLHTFTHDQYSLAPGAFLDVPTDIAKIWCEFKNMGTQEVVLGSEMPANTAPASSTPDPRKIELESENKELQQRIANLEKLLQNVQTGGRPQPPKVERRSPNPLS